MGLTNQSHKPFKPGLEVVGRGSKRFKARERVWRELQSKDLQAPSWS